MKGFKRLTGPRNNLPFLLLAHRKQKMIKINAYFHILRKKSI